MTPATSLGPDPSPLGANKPRVSPREVIRTLGFALTFGAILGPLLLFPPLSWQALAASMAAGAAYSATLYLLFFALPNSLVLASTLAGSVAGAAWWLLVGSNTQLWVAALWGAGFGLLWPVVEARLAPRTTS